MHQHYDVGLGPIACHTLAEAQELAAMLTHALALVADKGYDASVWIAPEMVMDHEDEPEDEDREHAG